MVCSFGCSGWKLNSLPHRRCMCCRRLVPRFEALLLKATSADLPLRVVVVGGGAAGVELACALQYRWAAAPHNQHVHPRQPQTLWLAFGGFQSQIWCSLDCTCAGVNCMPALCAGAAAAGSNGSARLRASAASLACLWCPGGQSSQAWRPTHAEPSCRSCRCAAFSAAALNCSVDAASSECYSYACRLPEQHSHICLPCHTAFAAGARRGSV